jgi:hypothetical protein
MKQQQIDLLRQQISKLDEKRFDLEAWKNYTIIVLARIFGENNQKIRQIEKLEYEHNSWSLRDTSGYSAYLQTAKKLGREILEASVDEIERFGVPEKPVETENTVNISVILNALEDELKGSQFKSLMKLLKSDLSEDEKKRQFHDIIEELGTQTTQAILESILLNAGFVEGLKE